MAKRTVGAVTLDIPTKEQREIRDWVQDNSVGAKMERANDAAEIKAAETKYRGPCITCTGHVFATDAEFAILKGECIRCPFEREHNGRTVEQQREEKSSW